MANNLAENPITIDTASANVIINWNICVHHMEFVNYAAQTDNVVVQNMNGHNVWDAIGDTTLSPISQGSQVGWIHGLKVPTLTSGLLKIYIKP